MPLTLNISLSRKVGEAPYGSRGATVGLELEAEAGLVQQPDAFFYQVESLFHLARESVDRELARPAAAAAQNGRAARFVRAATANQLRALHAIAGERQLDLTAELRARCGAARLDELSLREASRLIDSLQACGTPPQGPAPAGGD